MSSNPVTSQFKYRAFLSYRTTDARQAEWLHHKLEAYVVPRTLVGAKGEHGIVPKRLGKIFRDRDEMRASEQIEKVIDQELLQSQQLIVLCTPSAAAPDSWVPREIELFRKRRPDGAIHAAIGAGSPPHCFPAPLLTTDPQGKPEAPLAADLRPLREGGADGERKGLVRLIAGLLGVGFDDLWRREERRRRVRMFTKTAELAAVAVVAVGLIALGNFYRTHALVEIDSGSLMGVADGVRIVGTEEVPPENVSRQFVDRQATGGLTRLWVPTSNVILRVIASYHDRADRALSWHLSLASGFKLASKRLRRALPSSREIQAHPGMAYVPATAWIHGRENQRRTSSTPFWIDLRPPTVAEYTPLAERLLHRGQLDAGSSLLLTARQQAMAVERTGMKQLGSLNRDLGAILGAIDRASSPQVSAPGDIGLGLAQLPCDGCPAPMAWPEAEIYCRSRGMRLPTALEWELAVRGVDGRAYPWGDRFDPARANVPGLPNNGITPALTPVDAHRDQVSPFGLFDTVGNAGDWVVNDVTAYERVYMGATYRFNPEDATAFRMLPVTESDLFVREITARCVASTGTP